MALRSIPRVYIDLPTAQQKLDCQVLLGTLFDSRKTDEREKWRANNSVGGPGQPPFETINLLHKSQFSQDCEPIKLNRARSPPHHDRIICLRLFYFPLSLLVSLSSNTLFFSFSLYFHSFVLFLSLILFFSSLSLIFTLFLLFLFFLLSFYTFPIFYSYSLFYSLLLFRTILPLFSLSLSLFYSFFLSITCHIMMNITTEMDSQLTLTIKIKLTPHVRPDRTVSICAE